MRELNEDGSLKNAQLFFQEKGIVVGTVLVRKSDKIKCRVNAISADVISVESVDSAGNFADVKAADVLQGLWSRCQWKDTPDAKAVVPKVSSAPGFSQIMTAVGLQFKLCILATQHETVLNGVKVSLKPKCVTSSKSFDKNKLVLVPFVPKVMVCSDDPPKNAIKLMASSTDVSYFLKPSSTVPKTDDDMVIPFWFMETHASDFNMEIHWVKMDEYKLPVARNIRPIKDDEHLVLSISEPQVLAEPLFATDEPKTKKRRKSGD